MSLHMLNSEENMNPIQLQDHSGEPVRPMPTLPFMRRVLRVIKTMEDT
jgi:hypothetical protein